LFIFFKDKIEVFSELALEYEYKGIMQNMCCHLFRYLFVSLLLQRNKEMLKILKKFVKKISYTDVFIDFFNTLTQTFEFSNILSTIHILKEVMLYKKSRVVRMITFYIIAQKR